MRTFESLSEREILALAIQSEEEDARIYADIADGLRATFPASASVFEEMQKEEANHRSRLFDLYRQYTDPLTRIAEKETRKAKRRRKA